MKRREEKRVDKEENRLNKYTNQVEDMHLSFWLYDYLLKRFKQQQQQQQQQQRRRRRIRTFEFNLKKNFFI